MKKLFAAICQIFQDENGRISSARVLMIVGAGLILSVWSFLSIKNGIMIDIPLGVQTIFGILILGKVTQKFMEKNDEPPKVE